ncbi:MAG: hypothetical protein AB1744_07250 [Candidatus Zixiibacteriota bacterium]
MTQNPGPDLVQRTLRTTGIVLLILLLPGIYYFGVWPTLAVFSGGVWGMLNILFLAALVRNTLRPEKIDKVRVAGFALIKFPLLYVAGYFLLRVEQFEAVHLLVGFSLLLGVMVLKVIARALLGLDDRKHDRAQLPGAA